MKISWGEWGGNGFKEIWGRINIVQGMLVSVLLIWSVQVISTIVRVTKSITKVSFSLPLRGGKDNVWLAEAAAIVRPRRSILLFLILWLRIQIKFSTNLCWTPYRRKGEGIHSISVVRLYLRHTIRESGGLECGNCVSSQRWLVRYGSFDEQTRCLESFERSNRSVWGLVFFG